MKYKTAFTKKDFIVVLGCIVFLLAGIAAVSNSGRRRAKEAVCLANLHQWGAIYERYTNDNDGYFTTGINNRLAPPGTDTQLGVWVLALRPYYKDNEGMLVCPSASVPAEGNYDYGTFKAWQFKPKSMPGETLYGSYGENSWTNNATTDLGPGKTFKLVCFWKNVIGVKGKNNIPVLADSTWLDAWPFHLDEPPEYPDQFRVGNQGDENEMRHFCIDRHNGGINMLFMDWSARKIGLKQLWTLKWNKHWEKALSPPSEEFDPSPWVARGDYIPPWPYWMEKYKEFYVSSPTE